MNKFFILILSLFLITFLCFSFVTFACPNPEIVSLSVNKANNNQTINLTITGSKFHKSTYVKLTKDGQPDIMASNVKIVSNTEVSCTLDLNGKTTGQWNVVVANIGTFSKKDKPTILNNGFTIESATFTVTNIDPKEGMNNSIVTAKITGTNFKDGASVKLDKSGIKPVNAANVKIISATQISCELNLTAQPEGTYNLVVTNTDGQTVTLDNSFKVNQATSQKPTPVPQKPSITQLNESLKSIFFAYNQANIRDDQSAVVDSDLAILKTNPDLFISLSGYADERGTQTYNIQLSNQRAETVKKYLVAQGIVPAKIITYAFGEDYPAKTGHTEADWQYNRRVDITVWEVKPSKEQVLTVKPK